MISNRDEWNSTFKELKSIIKKPKDITNIIELLLDLHGYTHSSVNRNRSGTLEDILWEKGGNFKSFSDKKLYSAAWHLWHLLVHLNSAMRIL